MFAYPVLNVCILCTLLNLSPLSYSPSPPYRPFLILCPCLLLTCLPLSPGTIEDSSQLNFIYRGFVRLLNNVHLSESSYLPFSVTRMSIEQVTLLQCPISSPALSLGSSSFLLLHFFLLVESYPLISFHLIFSPVLSCPLLS